MIFYYYQAPLVKSSTKKCDIIGPNGELIGRVQRYFNSPLHRFIDLFIGRNNFIVRVKATDPNENITIDAYVKNRFLKKPDYYIKFFNGDWKGTTFHAKQLTEINISPDFLIKYYDIEIISKTNILDWVRFYQEGEEIARWHARATEKYKTHIEIEKAATIQDPLFYAVLGHMLYFIG